MQQYHFKKTGDNWYIDLPEYLEQGGNTADLQMVEGADTMLDIMAENKNDVTLTIDRKPFQGSDKLVLTEKCDPIIGGGYYYMQAYEEQEINITMWLCKVTEFVFGDLPQEIYVRREN